MSSRKRTFSVIIILILHLVALVAVIFGKKDQVLVLTPFNLLITFSLLLYNQKQKNVAFMVSSVLIILFAFLVELVGVQTGLFFGEYSYEGNLGPKIFGTPPIIGFNWWILIVSSAAFFTQSKWPLIVKILASALMMVMLDLWMEPLSSEFGFWSWKDGIIPFKNYIGWFLTASGLQYIYWKSKFEKENPIGRSVFLILFLFFMLSNLFLRH